MLRGELVDKLEVASWVASSEVIQNNPMGTGERRGNCYHSNWCFLTNEGAFGDIWRGNACALEDNSMCKQRDNGFACAAGGQAMSGSQEPWLCLTVQVGVAETEVS